MPEDTKRGIHLFNWVNHLSESLRLIQTRDSNHSFKNFNIACTFSDVWNRAFPIAESVWVKKISMLQPDRESFNSDRGFDFDSEQDFFMLFKMYLFDSDHRKSFCIRSEVQIWNVGFVNHCSDRDYRARSVDCGSFGAGSQIICFRSGFFCEHTGLLIQIGTSECGSFFQTFLFLFFKPNKTSNN